MEVSEEGRVDALTLGRTASFYYLKHESMRVLSEGLRDSMTVPEVSHLPSVYYLKHESMRVLSKGLRDGMTVPEVILLASLRLGCRLHPAKSRSHHCPLTGGL